MTGHVAPQRSHLFKQRAPLVSVMFAGSRHQSPFLFECPAIVF
jgi:hypothetical protein